MKLQSVIPSRMTVTVVSGIVFAAGIGSLLARADAWDKKTILTVNQTIQVRDTVLEPGQYVLKLYNSNAERHVVQIFNADQSRIINTVIAIPAQRMEPTGDTQFTFWETPAGSARALRKWFYPGDNFGQEFPYPKHLITLAVAAPMPAPSPAVVTEAEPTPQPEPQPEATTREREAEETPVETPPPPAEPQPSAEPQPAPAPAPAPAQELPKTSTPYPMLGIAGGVLVGLYGLLRLKRMA